MRQPEYLGRLDQVTEPLSAGFCSVEGKPQWDPPDRAATRLKMHRTESNMKETLSECLLVLF